MNYQFINNKKYNWKSERIGHMVVSYIGRYDSIIKILSYFKRTNTPKISRINEIMQGMNGNFSIVIESENWLFGLVDRISGYRLFYRVNGDDFNISNSPRELIRNGGSQSTDLTSILEIKMVGYLTGNRTIDSNINQLCAGEMIWFDKCSKKYSINNYFKFYTKNIRHQKDSLLIEELDNITDKIITRNIKDANGRTIWVPLSGGLDSRLIVCKLKQLGYDNLRTYSYGIVGNFDARRAKEIASIIGVQWEFIPTSSLEARNFFLSQDRKKYWDFADGLSVIPNLHGMFALKSLVNSGKMKQGDVIINGQSGDFITGQHIPIMPEQEASHTTLLNRILEKHYSLRGHLFFDPESLELMKQRIEDTLGEYQNIGSYQDLAKIYEYWEWKVRQVKRVVNGQCNYDYFGMNWELPLWDLEYMEFWVDLPLHQKVDRRLFVEYLNKMDFYGLFNKETKFMSRWPMNRIYIQFFGNMLSKMFGQEVSSSYYKKLDWYSQYQYIYALTGKSDYKRHWMNYKGPYPYMTNIWMSENIERKV